MGASRELYLIFFALYCYLFVYLRFMNEYTSSILVEFSDMLLMFIFAILIVVTTNIVSS